MNSPILSHRLANQGLSTIRFQKPAEIVSWFGAVQAQDYAGAKWALGLRTDALTDAGVDRAFNAGQILRTHVLRPTWHFVTPRDIRSLLQVTAPRVHVVNAFPYRTLELDPRLLRKSRTVLERILRDEAHLTRMEIGAGLARAGIEADGLRLGYILMHAELEQVICSGPRKGKQFTCALLDERAPRGGAPVPASDEALANLTTTYFRSHGPATIRDFSWWSGLTMREARRGLEIAGKGLASEDVNGLRYWSLRRSDVSVSSPAGVHLLPNYDESLIAYKDRGLAAVRVAPHGSRARQELTHHLTVRGRLAGSWQRTIGRDGVTVRVVPYAALTATERRSLTRTTARYARFLRLKIDDLRIDE